MSGQTVKTANCRKCGAMIVWMKSKRGKNVPVNVDSVDENDLDWEPPSDTNRDWTPKFVYGTHEAHFNTCSVEKQEKAAGDCPNCAKLRAENEQLRSQLEGRTPAGLREPAQATLEDDDIPF